MRKPSHPGFVAVKGAAVAQNAFGSSAGTCLIIDDDPDFAAFVDKVAQDFGLETHVLTDQTQLELCLETFNPNIITLDMDMPLRTGLEVLDVLTPRGLMPV